VLFRSGFAAERRHAEQACNLERARRLPVRLLLPLALLILPGFMVLVVGPAEPIGCPGLAGAGPT
jgi:hypothetical protein